MSPATLIRAARVRAGLSQVELAGRAGVPQSTIARLERPSSNPTFATLTRVLAATGHRAAIELRPGPAVDEAQIAAHLRMTPAERLRTHDKSLQAAGPLRRARLIPRGV
jgi:transcriptional regulator with XRE-family HTH domain